MSLQSEPAPPKVRPVARLGAGIGYHSVRLEVGYGITAVSFLIMFACGWLIQVTGKLTVTE
jgi:hypothetical protein